MQRLEKESCTELSVLPEEAELEIAETLEDAWGDGYDAGWDAAMKLVEAAAKMVADKREGDTRGNYKLDLGG